VNLLDDRNVRHVHCIGVGGIGVSALAEILLQRGFRVSGSDANDSERLTYLRSLGAEVFVGHTAENVGDADVVVYSSAIHEDNPELVRAVKNGATLVKRGRLLADIMQFYRSVAVSGTHGKTTTTAMLSHILVSAKLDPTYFIGGIPHDAESPVNLGSSDVFIAEADESDASFLFIQPNIAIVTNIERDHMSTYDGCENELCQSFLHFLKHIPQGGSAVLCFDDDNIKQLLPQVSCDVMGYGVDPSAHYCIKNYVQKGLTGFASIKTPNETIDVELNTLGLHNMKNAVAAMVVAHQLGISSAKIIAALKSFSGVGRRFQSYGDITLNSKTLSIYEDYGHHPTEIRETYHAAKTAFPDRRVVLAFQPHRYSRTRDLMDEFVDVLKDVDSLILLPTYAASEAIIEDATSDALHEQLQTQGASSQVVSQQQVENYLSRHAEDGDVILFQGAGDVGKLARTIAS
jgi:UDP-N-acetylmuramate--alanine ligase